MTADEIRTKLEEEVARLVKTREQHDSAAASLQESYSTLDNKVHKRKAGPTDEEQKKLNDLHDRLISHLGNGNNISQKLSQLRDPNELERRLRLAEIKVAQTAGIKERITKSKEEKQERVIRQKIAKQTAREQGFPEAYLAENGNFKPGWDTKAKTDAVQAALGYPNPNAVAKFKKQEAFALLEKRGWLGYLEKKRLAIQGSSKS